MQQDKDQNQEYVEIASPELEKIIAEGVQEYLDGKTIKLDFSKPLHEQLSSNK